jgi:two-component system sensor histidine kinase ChvG
VWSESRFADVRVFVATPIRIDEQVAGAVVISRTPREELQAMWHMGGGVAGTALIALWGAASVAGLSAWVATRSLRELQRGAHRIADGDFEGIGELAHPRRSHLAEVAQTAEAVSAMTERLQQRLAYIGEFASNMAHEFKTPIATLRGTVELLQDDDGRMSEAQRAKFLDNAARELGRLESVVAGLLALARVDASQDRTVFRLKELLAEVAAARALPLDGETSWVSADRGQLHTVLLNLLDNAVRHGVHPDGTPASVALEAFVGAEVTGFRVLDDGPGISEANLARVFDRFFTTDRVAGTGLGLALVRTVIERHGGLVRAESRPGRTVFTITLPRAT